MIISVITPTCYRPQMLKEMLDSLQNTADKFPIESIVIVDEDEESYQIAANHYMCHVLEFSKTKRGALSAWNRGLELSSGDVIVPSGDDHLYHPHWLDYALESHEKQLNGYGVVGMNDLAYKENQVATMWIFDRQFCKDHMGGIFAPPIYEYLCVDLHWEGVAKMTGNYYRDMRAKVEHRHSAHGKRPFDRHDVPKDKGMVERDMVTFMAQKAQGFPVTWEGVI